MTLRLTSPSFENLGEIPKNFTCEGNDLSPALAFGGVPERARSLALVVDDPDAPDPKAPRQTWVHWVVYNLPVTLRGLPEGTQGDKLPAGARAGSNDWQKSSYGGPCPPIGRHRYFFKLYALDTVLPDLGAPTQAELERAMKGHVVEKAELIGTYEKKQR